MKYHVTKEGKKIKLTDLELSHLENILKWIERRAKEGLTVRMGGGSCAEDMWYDEKTYYGEEAKSQLNFSDYNAEFERRILANKISSKPVLGEGFSYVWLDTNTGEFSRPFSKKDVKKYLDGKDIEQAKHDKWALIEYKSLNGVEFEF